MNHSRLGNQRQGNHHRRLQCADRRRCAAPPDRGPRRHQCRQRPRSTLEHGGPGQGRHGRQGARDRGYFKGEEVLVCEPLGVTPYVPKPLTSGSKAAGRFGKQEPPKVAWVFGTRIAETILASVHVRARKQVGHMDASNLIRVLPK
jgi:hypothetical protein